MFKNRTGDEVQNLKKILKENRNHGQDQGRCLNPNTAKAIGYAIEEQTIQRETNLLTDAIMGNDLKQGCNREKKDLRLQLQIGLKN